MAGIDKKRAPRTPSRNGEGSGQKRSQLSVSALRARRALERILEPTDVQFNGRRDWDITVVDSRLYARLLTGGSLALGETYMDGWWACPRLDEMVFRLVHHGLGCHRSLMREWPAILRAALFNLQNPRRARQIGEHHYDMGNDLFAAMLDSRMIYSCGYWKHAATLEEAQEAKLDLLCQKLQLKPGQRLLDIGCGWGGLLAYAAEHYGVTGVGLTVSREQRDHIRETLPSDLPVEVLLEDYREHDQAYDCIVSVGMFEHVGPKNYRTFFKTCRRLLKEPEGLLALQTIGASRTESRTDPWISKYIFPNSKLPSAAQITRPADNWFLIEDWQNFGPDYDRTLLAWHRNFISAWPELSKRYDERFRRMWEYYLLSCAGSFRAREIHLWQVVLTPGGCPGKRYDAPR